MYRDTDYNKVREFHKQYMEFGQDLSQYKKKIIIVGKTAVGKTSLKNVLRIFGFESEVSYTTRPIRFDEINGIDYHFVDINEMNRLISESKMCQYQKFNHNYYGTALSEWESKRLFIMTPQGMMSMFLSEYANLANTFIIHLHLSVEETIERLKHREMTDAEAKIRMVADDVEFSNIGDKLYNLSIEGVDLDQPEVIRYILNEYIKSHNK